MLHSFIRGRVDFYAFTLFLPAILISAVVFLGYGLLHIRELYWLNRTTYVFIPFSIPIAAEVIAEVIERANRRSFLSKAFSIALLGLFLMTGPVAAQDPNISPIQYARIREAPQLEIDNTLLLKASIIAEMAQSTNVDVLWIHSRDTFVEKIVYTGAGLKTEYYYSNALIKAVELYIFINRMKIPKLEALIENIHRADKVIDMGEKEYVSV
jgi:hypothetical protein